MAFIKRTRVLVGNVYLKHVEEIVITTFLYNKETNVYCLLLTLNTPERLNICWNKN